MYILKIPVMKNVNVIIGLRYFYIITHISRLVSCSRIIRQPGYTDLLMDEGLWIDEVLHIRRVLQQGSPGWSRSRLRFPVLYPGIR